MVSAMISATWLPSWAIVLLFLIATLVVLMLCSCMTLSAYTAVRIFLSSILVKAFQHTVFISSRYQNGSFF